MQICCRNWNRHKVRKALEIIVGQTEISVSIHFYSGVPCLSFVNILTSAVYYFELALLADSRLNKFNVGQYSTGS